MAFPSSTSNSERRGRRVFAAMLIALGVCALLDLSCRWLLPASDVVVRNHSAREFLRAEPVPDIQIFGESVMMQSLMADALGYDANVTVRNDSIPSSGPSDTYFLIREEFAGGRLPRAIVYSHMPRSFADPATALLAGTFAEWSELPAVYAAASRPTDALYGTLARLSYLLMHRNQFQDLIRKGDTRFFTIPDVEYRYAPREADRAVNRYLSDPSAYETSIETYDGYLANKDRFPFTVSDEADQYFRRTLKLAKEHNIPVFWLSPPVAESMSKVQAESGYYDDVAEYLAPFEQAGELTVLQLRPEVYANHLFTDRVHPKAEAAIQFSCSMRRYAPVIATAIGEPTNRIRGKVPDSDFVGAPSPAFEAPALADWTSRCRGSGSSSSTIAADASVGGV